MGGLRTSPRTDVDPPRFLPPSNFHRRGAAYRLAARGTIGPTLLSVLSLFSFYQFTTLIIPPLLFYSRLKPTFSTNPSRHSLSLPPSELTPYGLVQSSLFFLDISVFAFGFFFYSTLLLLVLCDRLNWDRISCLLSVFERRVKPAYHCVWSITSHSIHQTAH